MNVSQKEIKKTILANNCPECFTQDSLALTFYQKHLKTFLFKRATSEITNTMVCNKCNTTIYPVRWTDDIERVHEFYSKTINAKTSFKLTTEAYLLFFLVLGIMITSLIILTP